MTTFRGVGPTGAGSTVSVTAENVSITDGAGYYTATNVEDALAEIYLDFTGVYASTQEFTNKTINLASNTITGTIAQFNTALSDGDFATLAGTETLTNKTISVDDNTVSGVAASSFVLSNASGNIDGAAAQKAIPAGTVVGTTDSQTLTNKTLSTSSVWNGDVIGVTYGGTGSSSTPTNGQILIGNGTNYSVSTITAGTGISITNGAGTITIDNASPGLAYFTESRNTAAPNATVPVHAFTASGAETDIDVALSPKGSGALTAHIADSTAAGGNKRGAGAVDLQTSRAGSDQVSSGDYSTIGGGSLNQSNGTLSTIPGGFGATARGLYGRYSYASGVFISLGSAQIGTHVQRLATSDATASILTSNGSVIPSTTNVSVLPDNHAYTATATITARDDSTGDMASWKIEGAIKRGAGAATTALVGTPAITTIAMDAGASTWVVAMVANTTRGSVEIQVTGEAATTIHWVCKLDTVEVG